MLDHLLLQLERLDLLALALPRRLGRAAIAEDSLDPALLLLVFRLGTFPAPAASANGLGGRGEERGEGGGRAPAGYVPRREVRLGFWQLLAPRLALLDLLLLGGGGARHAAVHGAAEHALVLVGLRRHDFGRVHGVGRVEEGRVCGAGRRDEAVGEAVDGRLELDLRRRHDGRSRRGRGGASVVEAGRGR